MREPIAPSPRNATLLMFRLLLAASRGGLEMAASTHFPVLTEDTGTIPDRTGRRPHDSVAEVLNAHSPSRSARRPVHGLAKTSAGRSGIPSLAFHAAARSALPQSSYSRTTRSAASRSRD